jgi:hypothetical protein
VARHRPPESRVTGLRAVVAHEEVLARPHAPLAAPTVSALGLEGEPNA